MFTLFVILAVFLQIAIALAVYFRRKGGHTNVIFMFLTIALAAWAFTNYVAISIPQNDTTIYAIRTVLTFAVIQNTLFYLFAKTFPGIRISQLPKYDKLVILYSILLIALTQSPFLFQSVTIKNGTANPNPGPVMLFFVLHAVFTISLGLRSLVRQHRRAIGQKRNQLRFILFASVILWLVVPITNFIITLSAQTTLFVKFSPFYTFLFGIFITYAIVAQKLFDIRLIVARSVAYVLSLGLLAVGYATVSSLVANSVNSNQSSDSISLIVNIASFLLAVLLYPHIKNFFDKFTNKLFYRDAYDAQAFLDQLNRTLVGNVELEDLLEKSSKIIADTLKAEFCMFWIHTSYYPKRTFSASHHRLPEDDVDDIRAISPFMDKHLIVTDELYGDNKLFPLLQKNDIAVLAPIKFKNNSAGVGHLVLGQKKSGNPYNTQDIKLLGIIANELVIATQNALRFEEIEHFNVTLQEKVDDRTRQLRRTNERLKLLDQTKDDFISMASHQLRTPLTSVKGYLSMVLEGDAGKLNEKERKLLNQAFFSSQRMVYLIADLLNVSRLKTGKFIIEPTQVNLAEVIQGEVEQLVETAASRNLKLTYEKPKDFPTLMFDETKIRQVIMNFTDNAIHYTPSGGNIKVELKDTPHSVEFTVTDDGIGIPRHEQHHLFSKFFRAGNAKKARPDGTGLGLFMAKKVIIAQGGSIIFKSTEGKGSTFGFAFPKAHLKPSESHTKPAAEKMLHNAR